MRVIGGVAFDKGQKVKGTFRIPRTDYEIPCTIIAGEKPGKTVLLTAGVHGCEYVGIQAATQIQDSLKPENIAGTLIIVPVVNRSGFEQRLPTFVPEDGKNLNRVFPGKENGSHSEKIAYFMSQQIFSNIDFYIDLHSGGAYEDLKNYVYFVGACSDLVSEYAKGAAQVCHVPYMVRSSSKTGSYNCAGMMGVPSVLLERGGNGRWTKEEVQEDINDVINILKYLDMIEGEVEKPEKTPFLLTNPEYAEISYSGFWYTDLKAGDEIKRGQELGYVTDYDGRVLERLYSNHDGFVMYITRTLWASYLTEVVTYAKICDGHECLHDHGQLHSYVHADKMYENGIH